MADQQQQAPPSEPERGDTAASRARLSSRSPMAAEGHPAQLESPPVPSPPQREEMMACVVALEAALLPCLPARELQAVDRSVHCSHQSQSPHPFYPSPSFLLAESIAKASVPTRQVFMGPVSGTGEDVDVERHAREFMEAAKKLQLYFVGLQREDEPTKEEMLRKEISMMEEELKTKTELIKKHQRLIDGWRKELKEQLEKHVTELETV
ncbi:hypothetical protein C4D60_Mb08t05940 [Musa balbisiana]|uniref:Mediator of RNA polymerase II transcription subunit 28 n=1 Tax=Musa balbisiana TaxID=52838 RepID=A0A4S8K1M4_MUSBA|nr:hypothetical protein C4D60_Mb08t05940 [Musa balbisiana]